MEKIFQTKAKVIFNKRVKERYWRCAIETADIAATACPGQFLTIRFSDVGAPLLRRPFSIHRVKGKTIEIMYEVVGDGTRILSRKKPKEYLDIIGPLGNGFIFNGPTVIVSGGIGVAPLVFLAEKLACRKPLVLLGAKTKSQILCKNDFQKLGCRVTISTDDGSEGHKGKVTELLKGILRKNAITQERYNAIYACGPKPMLKEISRIAGQYKIAAEVSLEAHMACGIGACLGCVINTITGQQRVCKEGPVFKADEIVW